MKKNLGTLDRLIRFALAAVFIYLYARSYWFYAESLPGGDFVALSLFVVGVLLIISSVVGFCPVYAPFGLCSMKNAGKKEC
jgi:hypothetical protein